MVGNQAHGRFPPAAGPGSEVATTAAAGATTAPGMTNLPYLKVPASRTHGRKRRSLRTFHLRVIRSAGQVGWRKAGWQESDRHFFGNERRGSRFRLLFAAG